MDAISLPKHLVKIFKEVEPSAEQQVIGPPDGDLTNNEIRAVDVITTFDEQGPKISMFFKPDAEDLEVLQKGGIVQFTWWGDHLHPVSTQVWGA